MGTAEEHTTFFELQIHSMQTDVAERQNALHGSAKRYADFMVQVVTNEPRVKQVMKAVMKRQQSWHDCRLWQREVDDEHHREVVGQGSDRLQVTCVEGREEPCVVHSIQHGTGQM